MIDDREVSRKKVFAEMQELHPVSLELSKSRL